MKKLLIILFISIVVPLFGNYESEMDQSTDCYLMAEPIEIINYEEIYIEDDEQEPDAFEMAQKDYLEAMDRLDSITDRQQWFLEYKQIINEYAKLVDPPETIYDYFTDEELELLFRVVQAEIGDEYSFEQKCNVAGVIFNRLKNEAFEDNLHGLLTPDQFATIANGRYKEVAVSDTTILACEYVFEIGSVMNDALFFDSNGALKYRFITNDGAHNFYGL